MNERVLFRLSFLPALIVAGLAFLAIPSFMRMYASFGAELPSQTRFLFAWYQVLAFLPFLFLAGWFWWPQRASRGVAALMTSIVLSGVILWFGIWAAYTPLYMLGSQL
jgi:hypothetical protein